MTDDPPIDLGAIVTGAGDSGQWCQEHIDVLAEWEIPTISATTTIMEVILGLEELFVIAYRKRNGYDPPEGTDFSNLPSSEKPGPDHLNQALAEAAPLCCFVEEHAENPWPDEDAPPLIAILAHQAKESED